MINHSGLISRCSVVLLITTLGAHAFDGQVVDPEGRPLAGVVIYDISKRPLSVYNNKLAKTAHVTRCLSNRQGHFNLALESQPGMVLARDIEDRFGLFEIASLPGNCTIHEPGGIRGELRSGPEPLAQVEITATLQSECRTLRYWMQTSTNTGGEFHFSNMMPGSYVIQTIEEVPQVGCCFNRVVTRHLLTKVSGGQTTQVRLGGTDLPFLTGMISSTEDKPLHGVWVHLTPVQTAHATQAVPAVYADVTDPSGHYAIHDIPPGTYQLQLYRRLARNSGSRVLEKEMTVTIESKPQQVRPAHHQDIRVDLSPFTPLNYGQAAPLFKATLLNGKAFSLADQRGRPVILHFYATYCKACVQSFDFFESLHDQLQNQVVVVGISLDDDRQICEQFIRQKKVQHPQVYDGPYATSRLARQYHLANIPTTFIIDAKGMVSQIDLFGPTLEKHVRDKCLAKNME
jgi:peroxiredoxin